MQLLAWLACALPEAWIRALGRALGAVAWSVLRIRRRTTEDNLQQALGLTAAQARVLGRRCHDHACIGALEFLRLGRLTPHRASQIFGAEALARLQRLQQGSGVLVLTAHLGNWDLLACAAGLCGIKLNVVTRQIKAGWLNRFWMAQRAACGVKLLSAQGSALSIRRALLRNEVVALVLDQHEPGGLALPFFGRPAATGAALARLSLSTGCPVVPVFLPWIPGQGYGAVVLDPVHPQATGDTRADLEAHTRRYLAILEQQIQQTPEQWLWLHRRWKLPLPDTD